jgi:hypothetical protein
MQQQIFIVFGGASRTIFFPLAAPTVIRLAHSRFLRIFFRGDKSSLVGKSIRKVNYPPPAGRA